MKRSKFITLMLIMELLFIPPVRSVIGNPGQECCGSNRAKTPLERITEPMF